MAVIINHDIKEEQKNEAASYFGVEEFVLMPGHIADLWVNADPKAELNDLGIGRVVKWLEDATSKGDYVFVQGDYGLTYAIVDWCLSNSRHAVYATTNRVADERCSGNTTIIKREFRHVKFREYRRLT